MVRKWIGVVIVIVLITGAVLAIYRQKTNSIKVQSFADCAAKGYPIMESYPRQCRTPDGRSFSEDIGNAAEKASLIQITNPVPNQQVVSPLTVSGQAVGNWYFEASFPVKLFDASNNLLAETTAQASGNWMTTSFVPFTATLSFSPQPVNSTGILILYKDNPSGEPQNDDQLIVPVTF